MAKQYELMVLLRPDVDVSDEKKSQALIASIMREQAASVTSIENLGKKALAYPVKAQKEGNYLLVRLEGNAVNIGQAQKNADLKPEILRFMILAMNEKRAQKAVKK